ncbi:hypothetical protein [Devosia sp.]
MKYDSDISFANALPEAPMAMPKQKLERPRTFARTLRSMFAALAWF